MSAPRYQTIRRALFPGCAPAVVDDFMLPCPGETCPAPCGQQYMEISRFTINGAVVERNMLLDTSGEPQPPAPTQQPGDRPGYTTYVFGDQREIPVWRTDVKRDERGRVSEVVEVRYDLREITKLRYAPSGRITHETTVTIHGTRELAYTYDSSGRVVNMRATGAIKSDDLRELRIQYAADRISKRSALTRGPAGGELVLDVTYMYDDAGRPTRIQTDSHVKGSTASFAVVYDYTCG